MFIPALKIILKKNISFLDYVKDMMLWDQENNRKERIEP